MYQEPLRDKKLRELIERWSPWRRNPKWYVEDQLLKEYRSSELHKPPRLFYHIRKNIVKPYYGIITIRGPRRVGKTTMIKLLIHYLIEMHNVDPTNIYYISLDDVRLEREGIDLVDVLEFIASQGNEEKYVFLDEVSRFPQWARALKNAYDLGIIDRGKLKVVAFGSHSMDLAEAVAELRGRQGRLAQEFNVGGNLIQPSFRFSEVVESLRPEIDKYFSKRRFRDPKFRFRMLNELANGSIPRELEEIHDNYLQLLVELFEDYLLHGGFPIAINEYRRSNRISPQTYGFHAEIVIHDAREIGLDEENLKRVLEALLEPQGIATPKDLSDIRIIGRDERGAPEASTRRLQLGRYIDYLKTTWIIFLGYAEEGHHASCTPNYQSNPKLWVLDPFIYFALYSYIMNIPDPFAWSKHMLGTGFKGQLAECVVASHLLLAQQFFERVPSVNYERVLMYKPSRRDSQNARETDLILCINRREGDQLRQYRFVIEVKYRRSVPRIRSDERKIVLTRDYMSVEDNVVMIPVSLFLLLF